MLSSTQRTPFDSGVVFFPMITVKFEFGQETFEDKIIQNVLNYANSEK